MKKAVFTALAMFMIPACGEQTTDDAAALPAGEGVPGQEVAQELENAAEQSGAAGREVLEDAADVAEDQERLESVSEPGSFAQDAMQAAGNAESRAAREDTSGN